MSTVEDFSDQQYIEIFAREWEHLAAQAYAAYRDKGRGVFFADLSQIKAGMGEANPPLYFLTLDQFNESFSELEKRTVDLVHAYYPENMVVILVKRRTGIIATLYIGSDTGLLGPKDIFEKQKKRPVH